MNPVESYLSSRIGLRKTADTGLARHLGMGALAGAGAAAVVPLAGVVQKAITAIRKRHDFKQLMEVNPDLQQKAQQDPKQFNQLYNSLRSMNPHFAKDPVVAGTYMRRMSEFPDTAGQVIVESLSGLPKGGPGFELGLGGGQFSKGEQGKPGEFQYGAPSLRFKG